MAPESLPEPEVARKNYPGTAPLLNFHNHRLRLSADPSRVVVRPFHIAWQAQEIAASRPALLVNAVLRMEDHTASEQHDAPLKAVEERLWQPRRHSSARMVWLESHTDPTGPALSHDKREQHGAY